ncbi:MAG: gfo/Idh/MocA family oxidoreductase [Sphingobacteriaceae bacterium]|jgi:virulence factor|nr:gfo/Idh/MocA family oxidoreductase [Sphingobacteriaceae bacterium]
MKKIGIIGLGNIAEKAYLPVISRISGFEFHLCTRNEERLKEISASYRFSKVHSDLDSLIKEKINGAFVHTASESHFDIIKKLLEAGIHVFTDKPIATEYEQSQQLVELAESRNLLLMVGFNRRFAPAYQYLKETPEPMLIIMQKNRVFSPDEIRRFILDDFIHVVDTLRYLFTVPLDNLLINGIKKEGKLHQVVIQFVSKTGAVAIGIMNRGGNVTEEKVELMSTSVKAVALNLSQLHIENPNITGTVRADDWEPTLHKRGFEQMVSFFLEAVAENNIQASNSRDALLTHQICEWIIEKLEQQPEEVE